MQNYGQSQYLKTQVTTVDNLQLVILLYEGAIKFLRKAEEGIEEKNIEKRHKHINQALDIINELRNSLNISQGREIAESLAALYLFMTNHLIMANIKNDRHSIKDVVKILADLKEAWETIATKPEIKKQMANQPKPLGIRI